MTEIPALVTSNPLNNLNGGWPTKHKKTLFFNGQQCHRTHQRCAHVRISRVLNIFILYTKHALKPLFGQESNSSQ